MVGRTLWRSTRQIKPADLWDFAAALYCVLVILGWWGCV